MAKTTNERAVIDLVINGQQSKTSLKEVTIEANRAYSALVKMKEADDPAAYAQKLRDYKALNAAMREMRGNINDNSTAFSRFKQMAAGVAVGFLGGNLIETALSSISGGISKAINSYREFNAASQELSAVTGATGKDLAYLNQQAAETGPAVGKSGAEMLEAYKLMASAKPELLANKELLVETTKAAITLAQAGKIDLAEATKVTAESLNQFGESADQANRYINVIAAGAKAGSAEINEMGAALKNSGTVAAAQGVSFEQTNAVLQSLSTIALKGGEAGTQLRNVLLTLGSGSDDTNPKVVGLQKALDNLGKKNMSTAEMTKLFGKENITAAQHIINHRDQITELTKRVTGTQEAFTQAATNNASFDHQLEVFWAKVEGLAVSIGSKLVPALTAMLSGANGLIDALPKMGGWIQKNGEWLLMTAIPGLIAYHGALLKTTAASAAATLAEGYRKVAYEVGFRWMVISEAASKAYALATGVLTGQITIQTAVVTVARAGWAAFSAVLLANPIGIVVGALGGLVAAMKYFSEHTERALDVERKKQSLQQQSKLYTELNARAQADLNEKIAGYNQLSKKEQEELKKTIALKETEARMRLANAYARAREIAREAAEPTFWQGVKQGASSLVTGNWDLDKQKAQQAEANKAQAYADAKAAGNVDQLKADWENLKKMRADLDKPLTTTKTGGGSGGGMTEDQKKAAKEQEDANQAAILRIEKMKVDAIDDEQKREQAQARYEADRARETVRNSKQSAELKAVEIKAIETKLADDLKAIDDKYTKIKADESAKRMAAERKLAEDELQLRKALEQAKIDEMVANGDLTKQTGDQAKLMNEQTFLEAKLLLNQAHYDALAELYTKDAEKKAQIETEKKEAEAQIKKEVASNEGDQATARMAIAAAEVEGNQQMAAQQKRDAKDVFLAKKQIFDDSVAVLKGFFNENTVIYKAAMIAQQAWALGEVAINYSRAVMASIAASAGIPFPGNLLAIAKSLAMPTLQSAAAVANIRAQKFDAPAFAAGGFTGLGDSHIGVSGPSGWVEFPTLFQMGQRKFIAGEAGREFVISNRALQNPVVADFARMMDVAQKTGNYSQMTSIQPGAVAASPAPQAGNLSQDISSGIAMLIQEQQLTRATLAQRSNQNIDFNYRLFEQYKNNLDEARIENTLK